MTTEKTDTDVDECPSCPTGQMESGTTVLAFSELTRSVSRHRKTPARPSRIPVVVVTGIPAEVCDVCGEELIDSETTGRVLELVKDAQFLWTRDIRKLKGEGVTIGGEPGEEGGVIRIDFDTKTLPHEKALASDKS